MASSARERFVAWVARDESAASLSRFRRAFALIWLCYDLCDLLVSGTAFDRNWFDALVHGPPPGLIALQIGLCVCECALLSGWAIAAAAAAAAVLRTIEAFRYFALNDFFYFIVTSTFLVFSRPEIPSAPSVQQRVPAWVRDALVFQTAWIYLATGVLKLNPAFLSGAHFLVRHGYLVQAHWPYPAVMLPWLQSLRFNRGLAWLTVGAELTLGGLLLARRVRPLAVALVVGIHGFAALADNVWFFGVSMIAQVALLFPKTPPAKRRY